MEGPVDVTAGTVIDALQDWPRHKAICNKTGSTGRPPRVSDIERARGLFELDEGQDEGTEDVERLLDTVMPEPEDSRRPVDAFGDRGRTVDIPVPGAPGVSVQITSSTLDPALMRELRDVASSRLPRNAAEGDVGPRRNGFRWGISSQPISVTNLLA